jgi:predicted Rossmann-fold nucleotide-binding protein
MNTERKLLKIVSGGQTGIDRAALDFALKNNIPCGGWCPKGRIAEDGAIPEKYPLKEAKTLDYETRTELNVKDSDGTLILNRGGLNGGTALTIGFAQKHKKSYLIVDLNNYEEDKDDAISFGNALIFSGWVRQNGIKVLNIAGPRESKSPGIYKLARRFLEEVLSTTV